MDGEKGIAVNDLSYAYGARKALDRVSLTAHSGRFTALLGPNGAGKSTLVALLSGLFLPDVGRIEILGRDFARQPRRALAEMGIVFQQQTLDLDLTVGQNMRFAAALHGLSGTGARARIADSLARMGLGERDREKARALNSGHRRRLEIARALIHEPRCLVLDEPTVGLDVATRGELVRHVHALCREDRLTVLWATHLVDEVWDEDDLIVLDQGRIAAAAPVAEVLAGCGAASVLEAFTKLTDVAGGRAG